MASQHIIYILVLTTIGAHGLELTPAVWIEEEPGSFTCTDSIGVSIKLNGTDITRCLTGGNNICDPLKPYFTATVDGSTDIITFTIDSVSRTRDTGTWSCEGVVDNSVDIDVKVRALPIVQISPTRVKKGEILTLKGTVVAGYPLVPLTGFTWEKDGIVIIGETTSTYTVNQAQPSDNDAYVCTGNNGVGIGRSPPAEIYIIECRITFAIEILINVVLPSAIILIIVIIVIRVIYFKSKDKWLLWLIKLIINVLCDCCLWYLVYVVSDPETECQDISEWILQITVVIITPRGMIYLIYLKIKVEPVTGKGKKSDKVPATATGKKDTTDYATPLTLLLFLVVPSSVTLFILISMMCRKKNVAEGGNGTRPLPKPGKGKKRDKVTDVESGTPEQATATGNNDTTATATGKKDTTVM